MTRASSTTPKTLDQKQFRRNRFGLDSLPRPIIGNYSSVFLIGLKEIFEMSFRRAFAVVIAALVFTVSFTDTLSAQAKPAQAQQQRKLSNDERRDYSEVSQFLDEVIAGKQPAPPTSRSVFITTSSKPTTAPICRTRSSSLAGPSAPTP
jgi:hypothetical protein